MPKLAVVMPVFNGERFLRQAIESVLAQSWRDFRLIVVDDGSTDSSVKTVKSYADARIELLANEKNEGIAASLNRALRLVEEEFIARMDCDDVCHPDRLRKQLSFMQRNEAVGICGTWFRVIDSARKREFRGPCKAEQIMASMVFSNPLAHPTVMMRTRQMKANRLEYNVKEEPNEDYELWQRASECFPLANIPETLLYYRVHGESVSKKLQTSTSETLMRVLEGAHRRGLGWIGIVPTEDELRVHFEITNRRYAKADRLQEYESWLCLLRRRNLDERRFNPSIFGGIVLDNWFEVCHSVVQDEPGAVSTYFRSGLRRRMIMPRECKLVAKALIGKRGRKKDGSAVS